MLRRESRLIEMSKVSVVFCIRPIDKSVDDCILFGSSWIFNKKHALCVNYYTIIHTTKNTNLICKAFENCNSIDIINWHIKKTKHFKILKTMLLTIIYFKHFRDDFKCQTKQQKKKQKSYIFNVEFMWEAIIRKLILG